MNLTRGIAVIGFVAGLAGCGGTAAQELDTTPAMGAVQEWLAVVDRGSYGEAWEAASEGFRAAIERVKWETAAESARSPLGAPNSRKLRSATTTRTLPNVPDGEYVVIQFDTRFEKRPAANEVVTAIREADGKWRIAGYYVR